MESKPRSEIKPPAWFYLKDYDRDITQDIWEDAISMDISFNDPYYAQNNDDYHDRLASARQAIRCAKRTENEKLIFDKTAFRNAPYAEQKILDATFRFEYRMLNIHHSVCMSCLECRIEQTTTKTTSICSRCKKKIDRSAYNGDNLMLPIWTNDDGLTQYHIPMELQTLSVAEVLLIQRVSPLVPLVHIKNGTLGIKGHVCSYFQEVNEIATRLPRLPSEVRAVKMIRSYIDKKGENQVRVFMVNRNRVLRALYWLVKYHRDYKKAYEDGLLTIDPTALDWMASTGEEELPSITIENNRPSKPSDENIGVSETQCYEPDNEDNEIESSGITCHGNATLASDFGRSAMRSLKAAAKGNSDVPALDWPQQSDEAISEYDATIRIFVNAFPHLFPGGIADARENERKVDIKVSKWAKHLLFHHDGRFARDHVFCFYVYNYCLRQRNRDSGSYFVNSHISNPPRSLEELQESLRRGDHSFVNKIVYYNKRIRGSDAYWRLKRSELYNWIHYHIANGHGAPNGFFTLSCAEYFWPDMIRLLEERIWIAEGRQLNERGEKTDRNGESINLTDNRKARNKAVNDYAIVVQEFFIRRTEDYLNTVGRKVLGIEYYWLRYEFAKGRGQIHAHILVILNKSIQKRIQEEVNGANGCRDREAKAIASWARKQFGMTAEINTTIEAGDHE